MNSHGLPSFPSVPEVFQTSGVFFLELPQPHRVEISVFPCWRTSGFIQLRNGLPVSIHWSSHPQFFLEAQLDLYTGILP